MLSSRLRIPAWLILFAAIMPVAPAQIPGLGSSSPAAPAEAPADPLGRGSPRGTLLAFSRAAERNEIAAAAQYLQLEGTQRENAAFLTNELRALIDRELRESVSRISDTPSGSLDDGLPADRERIGPLVIRGRPIYLELVRVKDEDYGLVWLVSSQTLRDIPAMALVVDKTWIESHMPASLLKRELLGISLAHWTVLLGLIAAALAILRLLAAMVQFAAHRLIRDPRKRANWDAWYSATHVPVVVILTILAHFLVIPLLGFPITFRVGYARFGLVVFVVALTWLLRRSLKLGFTHARLLVRGKDRASTQSLMLLSERMVQALLLIIAAVLILILLGVESKTALAGLGVVGVALALGAQKTVENLLGGIFLLSDKALAVGDYCTIGTQSGTVEDVTLRSVRLRTTQQTLVSLPAGSLAQAGIENFATRQKMLVLTTLRLRYGTDVGQLRRILDGVRALLTAHATLETDSAYVRLINFGTDAIELELFAYVLTAEPEKFRAIREELLLQVASVVEAAGSALAPTRFIQLSPDTASAK